MIRLIQISIALIGFTAPGLLLNSQITLFSPAAMQEDFRQFRDILENEHCCLYEYTTKAEMDSLFDSHFNNIDHEMEANEFFTLLATITARIGCMHTSAWMPGSFFISKPTMMFPLKVNLIGDEVIVSGSYLPLNEVSRGSKLLEINDKPIKDVLEQLKMVVSADALNPYFISSEIGERFSLLYASVYGLPDQYMVKYLSPGKTEREVKILTPASHEAVHKVVYSKFSNPPLGFEVVHEKSTAIITVPTFIYYDKVDYFRYFMDSCFHLIKTNSIDNLILDLRGNDGGDPFCSSILLSYLQKSPVPYFAKKYGKYEALAEPLPLPENNFKGHLYTLVDGCCGSTNGHFCALLKYNKIGKFIGTPSGATYKCNAGRDTEFRLKNTQMILTIGRSTYSAAVRNMVKTAIMPDIYVHETYDDFLNKRDVYLEEAFKQIEKDKGALSEVPGDAESNL